MIKDQLRKIAHFLATIENEKLEELAKMYVEEIVTQHGVPLSIISNHDSRFALRFWQILQEEISTKVHLSITYQPQIDE